MRLVRSLERQAAAALCEPPAVGGKRKAIVERADERGAVACEQQHGAGAACSRRPFNINDHVRADMSCGAWRTGLERGEDRFASHYSLIWRGRAVHDTILGIEGCHFLPTRLVVQVGIKRNQPGAIMLGRAAVFRTHRRLAAMSAPSRSDLR